MKLLIVLLTGYSLLSQAGYAFAQGGLAANHDPTPAAHDPPAAVHDPTSSFSDRAAIGQLKVCCQKIAKDIQRIYYLNNRNGKMKLVVRGIYTHGKVLLFALKLVNRSSLDYEVDSIRFFLAEKQNGVHALRRLNELAPVYVFDSVALIKGHGHETNVIAIPRLTLARHRRLLIEVSEKNGGRQLLVQTANFTLEMARLI
jgi:Domain of unknown function (DUF4138)